MADLSTLQYDTQVVSFTGQVSRSVSFSRPFGGVPRVVATPSSDLNVNVWLSDITVTGLTVNISAPGTGDIQLTAIGTKP